MKCRPETFNKDNCADCDDYNECINPVKTKKNCLNCYNKTCNNHFNEDCGCSLWQPKPAEPCKHEWYHGTNEYGYNNVCEKGFLLHDRATSEQPQMSPCTWLATTRKEAEQYGNIVFKVKYDPKKNKDMNNYCEGCWQIRVYEPIPVSDILDVYLEIPQPDEEIKISDDKPAPTDSDEPTEPLYDTNKLYITKDNTDSNKVTPYYLDCSDNGVWLIKKAMQQVLIAGQSKEFAQILLDELNKACTYGANYQREVDEKEIDAFNDQLLTYEGRWHKAEDKIKELEEENQKLKVKEWTKLTECINEKILLEQTIKDKDREIKKLKGELK